MAHGLLKELQLNLLTLLIAPRVNLGALLKNFSLFVIPLLRSRVRIIDFTLPQRFAFIKIIKRNAVQLFKEFIVSLPFFAIRLKERLAFFQIKLRAGKFALFGQFDFFHFAHLELHGGLETIVILSHLFNHRFRHFKEPLMETVKIFRLIRHLHVFLKLRRRSFCHVINKRIVKRELLVNREVIRVKRRHALHELIALTTVLSFKLPLHVFSQLVNERLLARVGAHLSFQYRHKPERLRRWVG